MVTVYQTASYFSKEEMQLQWCCGDPGLALAAGARCTPSNVSPQQPAVSWCTLSATNMRR